MPLPKPVDALWAELQSVRAEVLKEAEGLSQGQADWRPSEKDWSVGEVVH
ncbi:MAG: DinB family protein, partial [Actinobacteria bacterium]